MSHSQRETVELPALPSTCPAAPCLAWLVGVAGTSSALATGRVAWAAKLATALVGMGSVQTTPLPATLAANDAVTAA